MAGKKRRAVQKKFLYFFLNGKVHKTIRTHRGKDELIAWCYSDKRRVLYAYSLIEKYAEMAYSIKQVGEILNRHKVTIENYILDGKIKEPEKIYPISNPQSKWTKFMLSQKDIIDLHEFLLEGGYSHTLPSKTELQGILKHNLILYTKTGDGKFVPVWKAE